MAERPTTGELYEAKSVTEADLVAAVDAYMADPTTSTFTMSDNHVLDLAAAVEANLFAKRMLADPAMRDAPKRTAVRAPVPHGSGSGTSSAFNNPECDALCVPGWPRLPLCRRVRSSGNHHRGAAQRVQY